MLKNHQKNIRKSEYFRFTCNLENLPKRPFGILTLNDAVLHKINIYIYDLCSGFYSIYKINKESSCHFPCTRTLNKIF